MSWTGQKNEVEDALENQLRKQLKLDQPPAVQTVQIVQTCLNSWALTMMEAIFTALLILILPPNILKVLLMILLIVRRKTNWSSRMSLEKPWKQSRTFQSSFH